MRYSPGAERSDVLWHGLADAHKIGRHARDRGGGRIHDDDRHLGLLRDIRQRHRVRRQVEAAEELDVVVQHQLLGQLPGLFGALARRVAVDELDFVRFVVRSLDGLAMQRLVGLDALLELGPPCREGAGKIGEQADLLDLSGHTTGPQQHHRGGDDC